MNRKPAAKGEGFSRGRAWLASMAFLALVMGVPGVSYLQYGRSVTEKVVTLFAMPFSMLWFGLIVSALVAWVWRRRKLACMLGILVAVIWLCSAPIVVMGWYRSVESQLEVWNEDTDPSLDVLVVLGGGTTRDPSGRSQFGSAGDRVGYAAQLFHAGKAPLLVTTGSPLPGTGKVDGPYQQTVEIWERLRIPPDRIDFLVGHNTYEEMKSLQERPELWQGKRVGLLTSAFHLPRAMRLARQAGLELIPVAADFRANSSASTILDWLPNPGSLSALDQMLREKLAGLVAR